jgi:hypothetical protein
MINQRPLPPGRNPIAVNNNNIYILSSTLSIKDKYHACKVRERV